VRGGGGDAGPLPYGWISDDALAHLCPDDPSDGPVSVRAASPELALVGAIVAVAVNDIRRGDPDALAWLAGNEPEPGPAFSIEVVADVLGIEVSDLRARIERAARSSTTARRHPLGDTRRRRAA